MPPEKMLQLVKDFFGRVMFLLDEEVNFKRDCSTTYQKCSDSLKKEMPPPGKKLGRLLSLCPLLLSCID